jgi:uncharacterized protein (TIGR03086 family)
MNAHAEMTAAAAETARLVANVRPDQLDDPTPCLEWDVRTLLNHIILWTAYSAEQRAYGQSVADELMSKDFAADPDFAADYAKQVDRAVAAWADPAAWERDLGVMGSSMAAADVAAMLIMEMALHGWDLAAATGQEYRLDDATAAFVLATVEQQAEMFRQYQGFAAAIETPEDATPFTRALALSGRDSSENR